VFHEVSRKIFAFIFKAARSVNYEDEFIRRVGDHTPSDTTSRPRRLESTLFSFMKTKYLMLLKGWICWYYENSTQHIRTIHATDTRTTSTEFAVFVCLCWGGGDSSVGIATSYGLDGPGIKYRWGRDIPHPSSPALGPTQRPIQRVPGLSRG